MLNLNRVEVIGNLTRDPELRYTPSNQAVTSFAIATNRRYKDQSGNWVDSPPEYHDVVVWGQVGERCSQVLHKGDRVFVAGRLQTRSWEAPDGQKKYKTEIVADSVIGPDLVNKNLSGGTGASEDSGTPAASSAPSTAPKAAKKPAAPVSADEINIDDIPF
jgi:single-strand DNA-binding protein